MINGHLRRIAFILSCFVLPTGICYAEDACQKWFDESKIPSTSSDCEIRCDVLIKDMSTFACAERCHEFCKGKKCIHDIYWTKKLKKGRPHKWDLSTEVSADWTEVEKDKLLEVLSRIPEDFKITDFDGFYRMKKSVSLGNPGTTYLNSIAIYDRAFSNPFLSTSRVVVHELAHVLYLNFSPKKRKNYQNTLGWKKEKISGSSRSGPFINTSAKESPDEDFANNIEYYLFEPERLKASVPIAFDWIRKNLLKDFKLKEGCSK